MASPSEICSVSVGGLYFNNWMTVEVSRNIDDNFIDHAVMTVSEPSSTASTLATLKLKPGDTAAVTLAGQQVLNGEVYLRQGAYNAKEHSVQIGISSLAQSVVASTVDGKPGQYVNQTLQQIASACFGKVGIGFSLSGAPSGAAKVFARVSEHQGETRQSFIERLCRMRNIHMVDGGNGSIVGFRGASSGSLSLVEGQNIIQARLLLANNDFASEIASKGNNFNQADADSNRQSQASTTLTPSNNRSVTVVAEEPGDNQDMQMRASHEADWSYFQTVDGVITVQGWLTPGGDLWFNHVREIVSIQSPMLLPNNSGLQFMIKGVTHKQSSDEGTTTDILIASNLAKGQEEASK